METLTWKKKGSRRTPEGTVITYTSNVPGLEIESRKRGIPHTQRPGTWDYTSYFVVRNGKDIAEKQRLKDAMTFADKLAAAGN